MMWLHKRTCKTHAVICLVFCAHIYAYSTLYCNARTL